MALGTIVGDLGLFFLSFFFSWIFSSFLFRLLKLVLLFTEIGRGVLFGFMRRCLQLPYSVHFLLSTLQCHNQ